MTKKANEAGLETLDVECTDLKESSRKTSEELQKLNANIMGTGGTSVMLQSFTDQFLGFQNLMITCLEKLDKERSSPKPQGTTSSYTPFVNYFSMGTWVGGKEGDILLHIPLPHW